MLEMKGQCERCETPLPMDSSEAMICSYECTFCAPCVTGPLEGRCPNCSGDFQQRPARVKQ